MKRVIIFAVVLLAFIQCKEEDNGNYSNFDIVFDNAQAALYFHIIFCEAENAWAIVDDKNYESFEYTFQDPENQNTFKKIIYDAEESTVTIEYNAWIPKNLNGTISVDFEADSYRKGEAARISLTGFSIEGQNITGNLVIQYKSTENDENDLYTFNVLEGAAIRKKDNNKAVLITASIANGDYERVAGGETILQQDDDEWKFWGIMRGMLRDRPNMKYTNTILHESAAHYSMGCITAKQGYSLITIPGRDNIECIYDCSDIHYHVVTHKIRNQ